jgi:hypothetical protein
MPLDPADSKCQGVQVRDLVLLHVGPAFTNPQKIERNRKTPYKLSYSPIVTLWESGYLYFAL